MNASCVATSFSCDPHISTAKGRKLDRARLDFSTKFFLHPLARPRGHGCLCSAITRIRLLRAGPGSKRGRSFSAKGDTIVPQSCFGNERDGSSRRWTSKVVSLRRTGSLIQLLWEARSIPPKHCCGKPTTRCRQRSMVKASPLPRPMHGLHTSAHTMTSPIRPFSGTRESRHSPVDTRGP